MQTFLFTYLSREINYFSFKKYKFWYFWSDNFVVKNIKEFVLDLKIILSTSFHTTFFIARPSG